MAFEDTGLRAPFLAEFSTARYTETPVGIDRHLVIQSEADETVAPNHGSALHARAHEPRDLLVIPRADHRITDPDHRRRAVARSLAWFEKHLRPL